MGAKKQIAVEPEKVTKAKVETPEKSIAVIVKYSDDLFAKTAPLVVTSKEGVEIATAYLGQIKTAITRSEELRTGFVKPLNDHVRNINAMFKEKSEPLEREFNRIKRLVSDYLMEEERKARAEEARKQKIREAADAKREAEGKEAIQTPVASVERPDTTVKTETGKSTMKKVWKFEVVDPSKIAREYLTVDEKLIRTAVQNGAREIAGVRIYEDIDLSVSGR